MECLIIGGTGTISEGIATEAVRNRYNVTILNRGTNNSRIPKGVNVLHGDLNNIDAMNSLLNGRFFDVVVDSITYSVEQLKRRTVLFEGRCRRYIFISSAAAIGKGSGILNEYSKKNPVWKYGVKKLQCEQYLAGGKFSFEYIIIRPSITYGDIRIPVPVACRKNPWTLINRIESNRPIVCFNYTGYYETTHNLMNIRDFSVYAVALFDKEAARDNDYIICSDKLYTWDDAYRTLYKILGKEEHVYEVDREVFRFMSPVLYDDIIYDKGTQGVNFSNSKVKRDTGVKVRELSLEDGMRALTGYLRQNYKDRPLEDEFNILTDAVLLCGVRERDMILDNYISGLDEDYKKMLKGVWRKRKFKYGLKNSFVFKLLKINNSR